MKGINQISFNRYDTLNDEHPYEYVMVAVANDGTRIVRRLFTSKGYDEAERDLRMRVETWLAMNK